MTWQDSYLVKGQVNSHNQTLHKYPSYAFLSTRIAQLSDHDKTSRQPRRVSCPHHMSRRIEHPVVARSNRQSRQDTLQVTVCVWQKSWSSSSVPNHILQKSTQPFVMRFIFRRNGTWPYLLLSLCQVSGQCILTNSYKKTFRNVLHISSIQSEGKLNIAVIPLPQILAQHLDENISIMEIDADFM